MKNYLLGILTVVFVLGVGIFSFNWGDRYRYAEMKKDCVKHRSLDLGRTYACIPVKLKKSKSKARNSIKEF